MDHRRVICEQLDQAAGPRSLAPCVCRGKPFAWIHPVKGKANQGIICLLPPFEESNAKIVMMEPGLMFFQFFRCTFVVSQGFIPLLHPLSDLSA